MAESQQGESGMAADLARQGASRLDAAASWLENRQPGEILDEVRSFARRRPGAFIAGAAILGLVGGRMTRGLTADSSSDQGQSSLAQASPSAGTYGGTTAQRRCHARLRRRRPRRCRHRGGLWRRHGIRSPRRHTWSSRSSRATSRDTDPTRVDAGIDPATYTHPGSSTGVPGESR